GAGPGPANARTGGAGRVDPAWPGPQADGARHVGVDDGDDATGGLVRRKIEGIGERADRRSSGVGLERHAAAEQARGTEATEEEIGVRDGGGAAAAPIARRPGMGARALGADPQRAARVTPCPASPARAPA